MLICGLAVSEMRLGFGFEATEMIGFSGFPNTRRPKSIALAEIGAL
jgi:hypothetical protein